VTLICAPSRLLGERGLQQQPGSPAAIVRRAASVASGFTETEVIPIRTRCSAKAGFVDGACPHSEEVIPSLHAVLTIWPIASRTAASDSSNSSAQTSESRSTPASTG
jgi:hypothetical protein